MRKHLLILFISLITVCTTTAQVSAQTRVTGKLLDSKTREPLIGASVLVKGTTVATSVSLDGTFKINVPNASSDVLVISYVGYVTKQITIDGKKDLGTITLDPASSSIGEVTVSSDLAIDRKTPIAVTTLNAEAIEDKIGTRDLASVLEVVPGVMYSNTTGFGDARVSIRGFSSTAKNGNVAMTINGIPVNDMENGNTYWSDFTGLSDVTTSMQVQRGLGASKIIVPSFGGTINITTRNTDAVKGGYVFEGIGSDNYNKIGALVSTGLTKDGWAATFQGSKTNGSYHADNTEFLAYNYFANISKVISASQTLSFSIMGASQQHNTRFNAPIAVFRNAPQGIRYNVDAGVLNGQPFDPYQNFFSKPLASLNHTWIINDKSSLSTVLYATYGTGGGISLVGKAPRINGAPGGSNSLPNGSYDYSPYDLTAVEKTNAASTDGSSATYLRTSENDHHWYGIRSTYNRQLTDDLNLAAGIDLKDYEGTHYESVNNLLGGQYVVDSGNINTPNNHAVTGDKVGFYNVDDILSGGAYLQSEYSKNDVSAFITLSGTETGQQRNDYFTYLNSDPNQHSPYVNVFTYQAKGGANYNLNDNMNVFANIGYITKPPYFDNVFINFRNDINKASIPEKMFSYELGYGYKISNFSAKINLYRSLYMNRAFTQATPPDANNVTYSINISGINEMHEGGELELKFSPIRKVTLNGSMSVGDWYYTTNSGPSQAFDANNKPIGNPYPPALVKGLKVGDAPQTQMHLGADVYILPDVKIGGDYLYNGNYTANFFFNSVSTAGLTPYKIPNVNMVNLNAVFKFKIAGLDASLTGNVNNLLNTIYISDATDGSAGSATSAPIAPKGLPQNVNVYYGYGRTFSTALKIKF